MRSGKQLTTLQDRYVDVLRGFFQCRAMTPSHLADMYFDGNSSTAKKWAEKLKTGGYLDEHPGGVGVPSYLYASIEGYRLLKEHGKLDAFPSISADVFEKRMEESVEHELEVMDVRAAFFRNLKYYPHLSITEFSTWNTLNQFDRKHASSKFGRSESAVQPDGCIRIQETTSVGIFEHQFVLEVDRGTASQDTLAQKAAAYLHYFQVGSEAEKAGRRNKQSPFRLLMVLKSDVRRKHVAERLLQNNPSVLTDVWLTTEALVQEKPFGAAWKCPMDFRTSPSEAWQGGDSHRVLVLPAT